MTTDEIKARLEVLETERKTADELVAQKAAELRDARRAADVLYNEYFNLIGELEARENEAFEARLQAEGKTLPRTPEFLGVGGTVEAEVKRLRGLDAARGAVQRQS